MIDREEEDEDMISLLFEKSAVVGLKLPKSTHLQLNSPVMNCKSVCLLRLSAYSGYQARSQRRWLGHSSFLGNSTTLFYTHLQTDIKMMKNKRLKQICNFLTDLDQNFKIETWDNGEGKNVIIENNIIISIPDDFEMMIHFEVEDK